MKQAELKPIRNASDKLDGLMRPSYTYARVGVAEDDGNIDVVLAIIEDLNGAIESFSKALF